MENATEIVVFLAVGIIFMGLATTIFLNWDFGGTANDFFNSYKEENPEGLEKVNKDIFTIRAFEIWKACEGNQTKRFLVYENETTETGNLSKEYMFEVYKALSYCSTIQSLEYGCGVREDMEFAEDIDLPAAVTIQCNNTMVIS